MLTILTYGTFDIMHYGHIEYLRKAKMMGDFLIVGLSTDNFAGKKGKRVYYKYESRRKMLESIRYVNLVIKQNNFNQKKNDILKYHVDVLVSSDDYKGKFDHLKKYCKVVYLNRAPEISTTKIKRDLKIYDTNEFE